MLALEVVAADLHLLAGEMVEGEVELQDRGAGVFGIRVALDHLAQGLQRLEGQALVAADGVDLVVIAEREQVLRIGCIVVARVEVEESLRGHPAVFVGVVLVVDEGLHDQRPLGEIGIGVEPLDFAEPLGRLFEIAVLEIELAALEDLLRGVLLDRLLLDIAAREQAGEPAATAAAHTLRTGRQPRHQREHRDGPGRPTKDPRPRGRGPFGAGFPGPGFAVAPHVVHGPRPPRAIVIQPAASLAREQPEPP